MSKFKKTEYTSPEEILKFPSHFVARSVTLKSEDFPSGKVKAGTVIGGKVNRLLEDDDEVAVEVSDVIDKDKAEGILLHDIDFRDTDQAVASMVIHGFINKDKVDIPKEIQEVMPLIVVL